MKFFGSVLVMVGLLLASTQVQALPKNFRNVDTFYIGAMPNEDDIDELATLGVETIISLHRLPASVAERAESLGLETHDYHLRTRLVQIEKIMDILDSAPAASVYVHCLHGADRAGAVAAYWLHTRRGYSALEALAMVISPSKYHLRGFKMLVREYRVSVAPIEPDIIGRYSGARNGGLEGLKIRGGEWYTKLARNYLELTMGPPAAKPKESFWREE